jgi:hypothetical protein
VDAYLDKMARDLEDAEQELNMLYYSSQPMEKPDAGLAATSDAIETSDDNLVTSNEADGSERMPQQPLLLFIQEDGRPIKLQIEPSLDKPDVEKNLLMNKTTLKVTSRFELLYYGQDNGSPGLFRSIIL